MPYGVDLKDERPTSNVQRRTSNNDVAPLRNLISFVYYFCFFSVLRLRSGPRACRTVVLILVTKILINSSVSFFSHSKFDVGRSMFDVHPFSVLCSFFQFLPHKNILALMRICPHIPTLPRRPHTTEAGII